MSLIPTTEVECHRILPCTCNSNYNFIHEGCKIHKTENATITMKEIVEMKEEIKVLRQLVNGILKNIEVLNKIHSLSFSNELNELLEKT